MSTADSVGWLKRHIQLCIYIYMKTWTFTPILYPTKKSKTHTQPNHSWTDMNLILCANIVRTNKPQIPFCLIVCVEHEYCMNDKPKMCNPNTAQINVAIELSGLDPICLLPLMEQLKYSSSLLLSHNQQTSSTIFNFINETNLLKIIHTNE